MHLYPIYPTSEMVPNLAFALQTCAARTVDECVPHLRGDFPPFGQFDFQIGFDQDVSIIAMGFKASGVPVVGEMERREFTRLKSLAGAARTYDDLKSRTELVGYFGWDQFLLVFDIVNGAINWDVAQVELMAWLNDAPLERALRLNIARVQAAIPTPPRYSLSRLQSAMWVLECDETFKQGTAFDLESYGTVTNEHVIRDVTAMFAFRAQAPTFRYPVRVVSANSALDLAIIEVVNGPRLSPLLADPDEVPHMAHVAVCGFPNFCLGDSGVLTPGLIVGTRRKSSVRRMLTNAPIIAGMSGGPALGGSGNVIGVCVSGSEFFRNAGETEDHAIIPVSALDILQAA